MVMGEEMAGLEDCCQSSSQQSDGTQSGTAAVIELCDSFDSEDDDGLANIVVAVKASTTQLTQQT